MGWPVIQGWTFDFNPREVQKFQGGATFWHFFIALAARYFCTKIVQNFCDFMIIIRYFSWFLNLFLSNTSAIVVISLIKPTAGEFFLKNGKFKAHFRPSTGGLLGHLRGGVCSICRGGARPPMLSSSLNLYVLTID